MVLVSRTVRAPVAVGLTTLALVLGQSSTGLAYPRPGRTERVSEGAAGQADAASSWATISADGRFVAFHGGATNLVEGDANETTDVFVRDRTTGETERVSVASDGMEAGGPSTRPAISAGGRVVTFMSSATNLVAGDTNGVPDVFVHDRETGETERVSVSTDEAQSVFSVLGSWDPSVSADGRFVAFKSDAMNFVPGDANSADDVFVRDRAAGTTERVSVASDGTEGDSASGWPRISADGRFVVFHSAAENLAGRDLNGPFVLDVFVHDRQTGRTEMVSRASDGAQGNSGSTVPSISADGRYVAFQSLSSNLVPADANGSEDVFVHDRVMGRTERVSVSTTGGEANGGSSFPTISPDGRFVVFGSGASNLVTGDLNGQPDVFLHDREVRATERVSAAISGQPNGGSFLASVGGGGRHVAFESNATNLVPGDGNGVRDVFVRERGSVVGIPSLEAVAAGGQVVASGTATFSGAPVTGADDPSDDSAADPRLGGELVGASLMFRPEQEDLLVRLRLAALPGVRVSAPRGSAVPSVVTTPGLVHGLGFTLEGTRYEMRAVFVNVEEYPPTQPLISLWRCTGTLCTEIAHLSGGYGTTGEEILASVRPSLLEAEEGAAFGQVRAFAAVGEALPGALVTLDEVTLPDGTVPARSVTIGVASRGTPEDEVTFATPAMLSDGSFSGSIPLPGPGPHEVWARACLGGACSSASTET